MIVHHGRIQSSHSQQRKFLFDLNKRIHNIPTPWSHYVKNVRVQQDGGDHGGVIFRQAGSSLHFDK
ncbi:hypothetical protein E2C01_040165 [Portunus trituberculatus]|uniref:Uncharacterized protein n=1 Tax=Portunus trituberculatus TaxID=210409 RepID=A0A5B7FLW3_PORTR|nr:hypothetical protein [Portunus trituberculatus]